jgi:DNA-directed RNA polymerase specialized sigma24 family protein
MAKDMEMTPQEEQTRLLALLIRLVLPNQNTAILELKKVGFGATRIGELLGTSTNTANVAIQKAKKKPVKRARAMLAAAASLPEPEELA